MSTLETQQIETVATRKVRIIIRVRQATDTEKNPAGQWWRLACDPQRASVAPPLWCDFDTRDAVEATVAQAEAFARWGASIPGWEKRPFEILGVVP